MTDDEHTTDESHDAGGRAHTGLDEDHPAGEGARSDRQTGGPSSDGETPVQDEPVEGAKGDRPSPFESHQ